jgi:hypothetical protein
MSPEDKARGWVAHLATKLRADLAAADEQAAVVDDELAAVGATPGRASMALVSVCIDRAYSALEGGFVRIARVLDGALPSGDDWHKALLHQMTLPITDRRPAVLQPETAAQLDLLLRHRHWLRHAYAAPFDWERMALAARALRPAVAAARTDVERLLSFAETAP